MRIVKPSVELLCITPNAEELIERAGRTCYKSEDKITPGSSEKFIRMIVARGHFSVLEHATATLRFVCDRGVTHEMVRHRTAAYSQESTRYCNYAKDKFGNEISVIEPPFANDALRDEWRKAMEAAEASYLRLLEAGAPPELARGVLPNSLATEIVMTSNFRNWLHFFEQRCSKAAHPQIREVANLALTILQKEAPAVFGGELDA